MKVAKIERAGATASAVIRNGMAHVIGPWIPGAATAVPFDLPARPIEQIRALAAAATERVPLSEVDLAMPSSPTTKFICLGLNYRNHVEETHNDLPANPALFLKTADALVAQGRPIVRPRCSEQFDYEGEIGVVIGKPGRHIAPADALDHVFGYSVMLDGSIRDFQTHSVTAGKNFWRSGAFGPWIVTADEIPDPTRLTLETRLNGRQVQHTTADLMLYDIPTAIAYISRWMPLAPGDVIATGTPGGVGARRTPPLWMKSGDVVEIEVSHIGVLGNPVIDED